MIAVFAVVIIVVAAIAVSFTINGNDSDDSSGSYDEGSVTIETYTAADGFINQTFDSIPERIIVGNMTILETLLYFGLGDRIVAIYYLEDELWDDPYVLSEFEKVEKRLGSEYITASTFAQSVLVDLEPDLIMGYASSFQESTFGEPSFWNKLNCNVWSTYCLNTARSLAHNITWNQMTLMEMDYQNIGKVFDIEDKTSEYMTDFKELVTKIQNNKPTKDITVCISEYSNSKDRFSSYGNTSYSGWLLSICGATNFSPNGGAIDVATMVDATDLDGFVLITYGTSSTVDGFTQKVLNNDIYSNVKPLHDKNYITWELNGNYGGASAMDILQTLYDYIMSL